MWTRFPSRVLSSRFLLQPADGLPDLASPGPYEAEEAEDLPRCRVKLTSLKSLPLERFRTSSITSPASGGVASFGGIQVAQLATHHLVHDGRIVVSTVFTVSRRWPSRRTVIVSQCSRSPACGG